MSQTDRSFCRRPPRPPVRPGALHVHPSSDLRTAAAQRSGNQGKDHEAVLLLPVTLALLPTSTATATRSAYLTSMMSTVLPLRPGVPAEDTDAEPGVAMRDDALDRLACTSSTSTMASTCASTSATVSPPSAR